MSKILVNVIEPSTPTGEVDIYKFRLLEILLGGISYKGDWQENSPYVLNDAVINGGSIYKCTSAHTSTSTFDGSKWAIIPPLV